MSAALLYTALWCTALVYFTLVQFNKVKCCTVRRNTRLYHDLISVFVTQLVIKKVLKIFAKMKLGCNPTIGPFEAIVLTQLPTDFRESGIKRYEHF